MKIILIMTVFERPEYLGQCLKSLSYTNFDGDLHFCMVNDASKNSETNKLFNNFKWMYPTTKIINKKNMGMFFGIRESIERFKKEDNLFCILESDTLVKPFWLNTMLNLYKKYNGVISGFNSRIHRSINLLDDCDEKNLMGGVNLLFGPNLADMAIRSTDMKFTWDQEFTKCARKNNVKLFAAKPSVVQHIGIISTVGSNNFDTSNDY